MTTLQEELEKKYSSGRDQLRSIDYCVNVTNVKNDLADNKKLDLREFKNAESIIITAKKKDLVHPLVELDLTGLGKLVRLECIDNELADINLSGCPNLRFLNLSGNVLTNLNFLDSLPHPERLEELNISNNCITGKENDGKLVGIDIDHFAKFIALKKIKIGTNKKALIEEGKFNRFSGSLKSWEPLVNLEEISIQTTDIDSGLEFLPMSLAERIAEKEKIIKPNCIDCFHNGMEVKCKDLWEQLYLHEHDLRSWQLANVEKLHTAQLKLFEDPKIGRKWTRILNVVGELKKE